MFLLNDKQGIRANGRAELFECCFLQNAVYCASHCRAANREERARLLCYDSGRTWLEMEVWVVFNPYLEQLSPQITNPLWIRRENKAQVEAVAEALFKRCLIAGKGKDFPVGAEEMVLLAQFGKIFDIIGLRKQD